MSDPLPRVGGLAESDKFERLVEAAPDAWWSGVGPFAGLHQLSSGAGARRAFRAVRRLSPGDR